MPSEAERSTGSGGGNSKPLIATFALIPTSMAGPGFRAPQAGSSPQPSASLQLSSSWSAIAPRNRRNASVWVSRCFWIAHVFTEGGGTSNRDGQQIHPNHVTQIWSPLRDGDTLAIVQFCRF